jgi:hypothetical protein
MRYLVSLMAIAAAAVALPSVASAQASVAGFDSSALPRCDDCFSSAQSLGFSINFYGTTYTDTYVSNNGYLTFGAGQSSFTPQGLGAGYTGLPIISAFFTDLDTRSAPSLPVTFGTGVFGGRAAFGANYSPVGLYPNNYTNLNDFQILLVDRSDVGAGDFDIVFNYDDINFGSNASAGYNAGQPGNPAGTYYQLPGSLSGEAFTGTGSNPLESTSNVGVAGRYVFNVRGGIVAPPTGAVPEPATWAMMILGFGVAGGALRRSRKVKTTVRFA